MLLALWYLIFFYLLITTGGDDPNVEFDEKTLELREREDSKTPDVGPYAFSVRRALLPFRQLSWFLKRPQPAHTQGVSADKIFDTSTSSGTHKRYDQDGDEDKLTDDEYDLPDIILVRPMNVRMLMNENINRTQTSTTGSVLTHNVANLKKTPTERSSGNKPGKDRGINIKLSFSVDLGNHSEASNTQNIDAPDGVTIDSFVVSPLKHSKPQDGKNQSDE